MPRGQGPGLVPGVSWESTTVPSTCRDIVVYSLTSCLGELFILILMPSWNKNLLWAYCAWSSEVDNTGSCSQEACFRELP